MTGAGGRVSQQGFPAVEGASCYTRRHGDCPRVAHGLTRFRRGKWALRSRQVHHGSSQDPVRRNLRAMARLREFSDPSPPPPAVPSRSGKSSKPGKASTRPRASELELDEPGARPPAPAERAERLAWRELRVGYAGGWVVIPAGDRYFAIRSSASSPDGTGPIRRSQSALPASLRSSRYPSVAVNVGREHVQSEHACEQVVFGRALNGGASRREVDADLSECLNTKVLWLSLIHISEPTRPY